jgi:hypothetical protein
MKQTAVEWLVEQLKELNTPRTWTQIINQAKEMEKQQVSNAYQIGILDGLNHQPRDYYNETFKNETTV